jgi:hypothetical protein
MESSYFGIVLFFALVALAKWKIRHDKVKRMNRGLNSYVTTQRLPAVEVEEVDEHETVEAA